MISPLLPVDGVGEVKRREPGRARGVGACVVASVVGDRLDTGQMALAGAGVTPISSVLVGGSFPGFRAPFSGVSPRARSTRGLMILPPRPLSFCCNPGFRERTWVGLI